MMGFMQTVFKDKQEKIDPVQSGQIITLVKQVSGADYYNVEINGQEYSNVPCPIPDWLEKQLALEDIVKGLIQTERRKIKTTRQPLYKSGDNVEVTFEGGNRHMPKISIEASRKKYENLEIIYI
jgi:hypothetical protein